MTLTKQDQKYITEAITVSQNETIKQISEVITDFVGVVSDDFVRVHSKLAEHDTHFDTLEGRVGVIEGSLAVTQKYMHDIKADIFEMKNLIKAIDER